MRSLCLCLLLVGLLALIAPARTEERSEKAPEGVRLEGTVHYTGPIPKPIEVIEAQTVRQLIEVHKKTAGLKDAVLWLEGVPVPRKDKPDALPGVQMDQVNHFFVPHVLTIQAGQEVTFLNSDAANHGVLGSSSEPKNCFNAVTPPGGAFKHRFVATRRPVKIGCPLHAGMGAWVYVFEHPYHAVTSAEGRFCLPPVLPGKYVLMIHHADGNLRRQVSSFIQNQAISFTGTGHPCGCRLQR